MTNKELQEKLREYPDDAVIVIKNWWYDLNSYAGLKLFDNKENELFYIDEVDTEIN